MKVVEILRDKGHNVVTVAPNASVRASIERMTHNHIGALAVLNDGGELVGLFSERDVVEALGRSGAGILANPVADVMTHNVITCSPEDRVNDLMAVMTRRRVRHLPVMDRGRLAGMISIGDLVKARLNELELESSVLRDAYPSRSLSFRHIVKYTRLGCSGLQVSRIALGCMSFGDTSRGYNEWALDDEAAQPLFEQAVEQGINLWDTANVYGFGTSEEIVGRAVKKYARRDDIVLATKLYFKMHDGPGGSGLSRKAIMEQVDASLARLGTDYIDLYQIHRFDPETPVEETMEALHDVVRAGKARYLGASSMWAWQFAKMQHAAELHGWTRFVSVQDQYNLMQREEEREMFGVLADQGVGSIPWSPLAKGRLARPWGEHTRRSDSDPLGQRFEVDSDRPIVEAVQRIAEARHLPMAQVALAWVLKHPVVAAPLVGPTKPHHLADAVAALDVELTDDEVNALESPYTPHVPTGF